VGRVSDKEKPSRQKVPLWAWIIAALVIASTLYSRMLS
jgi:hypothetical protein